MLNFVTQHGALTFQMSPIIVTLLTAVHCTVRNIWQLLVKSDCTIYFLNHMQCEFFF